MAGDVSTKRSRTDIKRMLAQGPTTPLIECYFKCVNVLFLFKVCGWFAPSVSDYRGVQMLNEIYNSALNYTNKYKWVVHPLSPPTDNKSAPGKRPLTPKWSDLKKPLTKQQLESQFKNKSVNIGVVCGSVSNLTIIDIDDGLFLSDLMAGVDDDAFVMSTRIKGRGHLFFKHCDETWLKNYEYDYIKIDVRNDNEKGGGGNIVLPPSTHVSGDVYKFNKPDFKLEDIPVIPDQLKINFKQLIKLNTELSNAAKKSRKWVREFLSNPEVLHGRDGRRCMLALCAELKANGFTSDENGTFISRIVYRNDYDSTVSSDQWGYVEPFPWKSDKLIAEFPEFCNEKNTHGTIDNSPSSPEQKKQIGTFVVLDTKKFKNMQQIYSNVHVDKFEHNGQTVYDCADISFLEFGLIHNIIKTVSVKDNNTLPIIDTVAKLESMITCMEIKDGKQPIYYIKIKNSVLRFEPNDLLNISKWRESLLANCKIVMALRSKKLRTEFDVLIAKLLQSAHIIWNDVESDEDMLVSIICEELSKLVYVDSLETLRSMEMSCFDDGFVKIIKSSTLHQIMRNRNIGLTIRKVREIMRPFLYKNSEQIRIKGEKVSVWYFNSVKDIKN